MSAGEASTPPPTPPDKDEVSEKWRPRHVVEVVVGLGPAAFFLFPFILVGVLGMLLAEIAGGALD